MSDRLDLYAVGRVDKAYGIKGEVVVRLMTGSATRFLKLKRAFLGKGPNEVREVTVEHARVETRGVRLKFGGIHDRTAAEKLRGELLFVAGAERIQVPRGTYFIHDVVGMQVVDDNEKAVGVVKEVLRLPAHDVYVIDVHGREVMVPAVKEFVRKIDIGRKTMEVRLIDGMAD